MPLPLPLPLALALGVSAALGGCSLPADNASAAEPRDEKAAPTFVSLNPCLDAILVDLMSPILDDDRILALSHYSRDPSSSSLDVQEARWFATTGGTAEEIIALSPDIVLASTFLPPATRSALERAGLRVETFASPASVEESAAQIERLGALAGKEFEAAGLARSIQRPLWPPFYDLPDPPLEGSKPGPDPSLLLWQPGQIVAGQNTLIAQLIQEEGFASHAGERGLDQADHVTLEQVMSDPPDVLLVAGDSAGQRHPALEKLGDMRVHAFDPGLFFCGGPSVNEAREELSELRMSFEDLGE